MDAKTTWLISFVAAYWTYCLWWSVRGALRSRTATDYMIAGRRLNPVVFVLAGTATFFSGWLFIGHPGLIYRAGFAYAYLSFCALVIPLSGVLFIKRQWMLGRRYGFTTPGEMLAAYLGSKLVRPLTALTALAFAIPLLAVQLRAAGFLFDGLSGGLLSLEVGVWLLAGVLALAAGAGGMRGSPHVEAAQSIVLAAGIIALGVAVLVYVPDLRQGVARLTALGADGQALFGSTTVDGHSGYIALNGILRAVGESANAAGGPWTGMMTLTFLLAMLGLQAAPAFSMWAFAQRDPTPLAAQHVWASGFGGGLILLVAAALIGVGGHFLGADRPFLAAHPERVNDVLGAGLGGRDVTTSPLRAEGLMLYWIAWLGDALPWLAALVAVAALAAMQSTGVAYLVATGFMLAHDGVRRLAPNASALRQSVWSRAGAFGLIALALALALSTTDDLVPLAGLALAYGAQMVPALIAVCWWSFLTRQGVITGLIGGLLAVSLTDTSGLGLLAALGLDPPWGRWPLTIHSAGWGLFCNWSLAIVVSLFTQDESATEHRLRFHHFLRRHASLPAHKKRWMAVAWAGALIWFCFAVGPGAVIGNGIFGHPTDPTTWWFGIPSVWTWQLLWWALGVALLWLLAFKLELSTLAVADIEDLTDVDTAPPRR